MDSIHAENNHFEREILEKLQNFKNFEWDWLIGMIFYEDEHF